MEGKCNPIKYRKHLPGFPLTMAKASDATSLKSGGGEALSPCHEENDKIVLSRILMQRGKELDGAIQHASPSSVLLTRLSHTPRLPQGPQMSDSSMASEWTRVSWDLC